MQCFQKDPNLRVSARKLLKHPWIVNARRSDSVVPNEEAVKSVQQWNEALKSPNAGSLRRASRPMSSSPIPGRRDPPAVLSTPARGALALAKPRAIAEQFRSPDNTPDDIWDDDFASAISPSALQLPHLRPHDNFGGLLSSEKLKAYASFETVTEEANWDDNFEGELTVKRSTQLPESDPLQTIRPYHPKRADAHDIKRTPQIESPDKNTSQPPRPQNGAKAVMQKRPNGQKIIMPPRPTMLYRENSVEDYSDLLVSSDGVFETKCLVSNVGLSRSDDPQPQC